MHLLLLSPKVNMYQVISTQLLAEANPDMNSFLNPNFGFKSRYTMTVEHSIELFDKAGKNRTTTAYSLFSLVQAFLNLKLCV